MPIDIKKRQTDATEMRRYMIASEYTNDRSASDLLLLAEIIRDNKNKNARWEAYQSSPTFDEGVDTKNLFNTFLEPRVREYVKASDGKNLHGDLVRWSICIEDKYSTLEEFDQLIEAYIERQQKIQDSNDATLNASHDFYSSYNSQVGRESNDIEASVARMNRIGAFIGFALVCVPVVAVTLYLAGAFDPSPEEIAATEQKAVENRRAILDSCVETLSQQISSSCRSDPVFSYCSLNYDANAILGSGCTRTIEAQGSYQEQAEFCEVESLAGVRTSCAIEIYGAAAVTGTSNL
jgi:hypothetical protein